MMKRPIGPIRPVGRNLIAERGKAWYNLNKMIGIFLSEEE